MNNAWVIYCASAWAICHTSGTDPQAYVEACSLKTSPSQPGPGDEICHYWWKPAQSILIFICKNFFSPGATTPVGGCILQPSSGL